MFRQLIERFLGGLSLAGRMLREVILRFIDNIIFGFRRLTGVFTAAGAQVPKLLQALSTAGKKPAQKEDYIETKGMFISKSFITAALLVIAAFVVAWILVIQPFLVRKFFVKKFWEEDKKIEGYSGKVLIHYDKAKKQKKFEGRLQDGLASGTGKEWDRDGQVVFEGDFLEGHRTGSGKIYEDGNIVYDGNLSEGIYSGDGRLYGPGHNLLYSGHFTDGKYDGTGELYYEDGKKQYSGTWAEGIYEGRGTLYEDDENNNFLYKGSLAEGVYEGNGDLYENGRVVYSGSWAEGMKNGRGKEYFGGDLIYSGDFADDKRNGTGKAYENGEVVYSGDWEEGRKTGEGSIYSQGRLIYRGELKNGLYDGDGELFYQNGSPCYKGLFDMGNFSGDGVYTTEDGVEITASFSGKTVKESGICAIEGKKVYDGEMKGLSASGEGTSYTVAGDTAYTGTFYAGNPDPSDLMGVSASEAREHFGSEPASVLDTDAFVLTDPVTGISLYCSYADAYSEPTVKRVFMSAASSDRHLERFKWKTLGDYEKTAVLMGDTVSCTEGKSACSIPGIVPAASKLPKNEPVSYRAYIQENGTKLVIWTSGEGKLTDRILLVEYRPASDENFGFPELEEQARTAGVGLPDEQDAATAGASGQGGTPAALKDGAEEENLSDSKKAEAAALNRTVDSLLTDKDNTVTAGSELTALLMKAKEDGSEYVLMDEVLTYIGSTYAMSAAEANIEIYNKILESTQKAVSTGAADASAADEIRRKIEDCEVTKASEEIKRINTERNIFIATGDVPGQWDASLILLTVDPAGMTEEELITAQTAYENRIRIGPHVVVDTEKIRTEIGLQYRLLSVIYSNIVRSRDDLQKAEDALKKAQTDHLTGQATSEQVESLKADINTVRADLISAACSFTSTLAMLNDMTGGYISARYGWYPDVFIK